MSDILVTQRRRRCELGFTLIEMVIAAFMLLVLSFMVTALIMSGSDGTKYANRLNRVTELSQEVMDDILRELRSAVRIFEDDAIGNAYRGLVAPWPEGQAIASSRLPKVEESEIFDKDVSGSIKTGNELFFARSSWADSFVCTSGKTYRVDVYRLVRFHLKKEGAGAVAGLPTGINFCKWVSEPMVDAVQIAAITDATDRAEVLVHLHDGTADSTGVSRDRVQVVWQLGADPVTAGTLQQIRADGSLSDTPESPRATIWQIERQEQLCNRGMLQYRWHSITSNFGRSNSGVGRFGIIDLAGDGFPHGFEVQVVGPSSARKVLLHLCLVSANEEGRRAYFELQAVADVREG